VAGVCVDEPDAGETPDTQVDAQIPDAAADARVPDARPLDGPLPDVPRSPEICDGVDNDVDGAIDEGVCACQPDGAPRVFGGPAVGPPSLAERAAGTPSAAWLTTTQEEGTSPWLFMGEREGPLTLAQTRADLFGAPVLALLAGRHVAVARYEVEGAAAMGWSLGEAGPADSWALRRHDGRAFETPSDLGGARVGRSLAAAFTHQEADTRTLSLVRLDADGFSAPVELARGDFTRMAPAVATVSRRLLVAVARDEGRTLRVLDAMGDHAPAEVHLDGFISAVRLASRQQDDVALLAVTYTRGRESIARLFVVRLADAVEVQPTEFEVVVHDRTTPAVGRTDGGFAVALLQLGAVRYLQFDLAGVQLGEAHAVEVVDPGGDGVADLAVAARGAMRWVAWTRSRGAEPGLVMQPMNCR